MRPDSLWIRACRALVCAATLANQGLLPAVHEWSEASAETAYHRGEAAPRAERLAPGNDRAHRHHDEERCETCWLASVSRVPPAPSSFGVAPRAPGSSLPFLGRLAAPSAPNAAGPSPRGPPQA